MGAVAGVGNTFTLPNYVGELFLVTPTTTPFTSMIGGLNSWEPCTAKEFGWQTDDLPTPAQPAILEGADAVFAERSRAEVQNTTQIHQEGIYITYSKLAAVGNTSGTIQIQGSNPVQNEFDRQHLLKLKKIARDTNYSFHQGAYQQGADASTARKTRGIQAAIATNAVSASSTRLSRDHMDAMFKLMADSGCPFENVVVFVNSFNKQRISNIYGFAPMDRNVGGLDVETIITDFGQVGVMYDRDVSTSVVEAVELSVCKARVLEIPGKGFLFTEPLAKSGSYEKWQLYGEIGLEYGPEQWHGKVTSTATS